MKKVILSLFVVLAFANVALAQGKPIPCKITDSGDLYSTYSWDEPKDKESLERQLGVRYAADVIKYSHEDNWPSGIATLDGRNANRAELNSYNIEQVADLGDKYVVVVSPTQNRDKPSNMKPSRDIYLIIAKTGVTCGNDGSNGVASNSKLVKITIPGSLMSTYDFEPHRDDLLEQTEKSDAEVDIMITYAHERNWPSGIATLAARDKTRDLMTQYHLYFAADISDTDVLLYCPAKENQHVQADMRPKHDLWFAYQKKGVKLP